MWRWWWHHMHAISLRDWEEETHKENWTQATWKEGFGGKALKGHSVDVEKWPPEPNAMETHRACLRAESHERDSHCNCCLLVAVSVYSNNLTKGNSLEEKARKPEASSMYWKALPLSFSNTNLLQKKKKKMTAPYCNHQVQWILTASLIAEGLSPSNQREFWTMTV